MIYEIWLVGLIIKYDLRFAVKLIINPGVTSEIANLTEVAPTVMLIEVQQ